MSESTQQTDKQPDNVNFSDIAPAIEFMCWTVLCLAPFLRWVNGQAVSTDQFVIQVILVSLAAVGGVSLRIYSRLSRTAKSEKGG